MRTVFAFDGSYACCAIPHCVCSSYTQPAPGSTSDTLRIEHAVALVICIHKHVSDEAQLSPASMVTATAQLRRSFLTRAPCALQVLELHAAARDWHNDSVQAKGAGSVASAVLRLAVAAASVQPANKSAQREAHAFVAQHASPLLSILRAAGSNAPRSA